PAYLLGVEEALIKKGALLAGGRPLHLGRLTAATSANSGWLGRTIFGSGAAHSKAYLPGTGVILDHEGGSPEQRPTIALGLDEKC
ncbi:hypothetical protein TNCT_30961, partial [Trichonephila clavata]